MVLVCRGSYDGYVKHKRNDPMCHPWDSQGNETMQFLFLLLFDLTFLPEIKIYNFRAMQNKKPFELILHAGRVTSLQRWKGSQK